jgi:cysteine-rich repeat protein
MRVWFIPFLFLSILIGWTLGLTACARSAEQGWIPVDPPERMDLPRSAEPFGRSVDGMRRPSLGEGDPDPGDAGVPEVIAPDAGEAASGEDAGLPDAGSDAGSVWDLTRRCGDGVVQLGEGCDDGNEVGGDGCSATCTIE